MKKILFSLMAMFAGMAIAGPASALTVSDYTAGTAANGIGNTRHNMGSFGRVLYTNATSEICVFCHTPHHSNTTVTPAPLWNRGSAAASYTAYGTTIGGSNITSVGSVSLACLSCHDGVTTFDNLVNAPGKGGVTPGGANLSWRFYMNTSGLSSTSWDHFDPSTGGPCNSCHVGALGESDNPALRLTIGTDLSNDHPVSVVYTTGRAGLRPTTTVISTINLTADLSASASTAFGGNLAQNRWAVKGFVSDTATIADLLRDNKVECSSCHDPHFKNGSWDEAEPTWDSSVLNIPYCSPPEQCSDGNFLRRVGGNTGSGVCRTCHDK
jgi:hypothetical protein